MASLQRIEIRDLFAPSSPTPGKVLAHVRDILGCTIEDPRPGMQNLTLHMPLADPSAQHCALRRIVRRVMSDGSWREYRISQMQETTGDGGDSLQITALDPIMDLAGADIIRRVTTAGLVFFDDGLNQVTITQAIDNLIVGRLPPEYSFFVTGTIEPSGLYDVSIEAATPLSCLEQLAALATDVSTGLPAEYRIRQTSSAFFIDVVREVGESEPIADIRSRKNLTNVSRTEDAEPMVTVVVPFGEDDGAGPTSIDKCAWRLTLQSGTTYQITDPEGGPSPILEDSQLLGAHVVPNSASDPPVEIVGVVAGSPALVTLASGTGIVSGEVYELRADSSGTMVSEISSPSRVAPPPTGFGRSVASLSRPVVATRNYAPNAFQRQWSNPANPPDGYTFSTSNISHGVLSQNTDPLYTEYGGRSARIQTTIGVGVVTEFRTPLFFPRIVDGANQIAFKFRLFFEQFTGDVAILAWFRTGSGGFPGGSPATIVPVDYPGTTSAERITTGAWVDFGKEGFDASSLPPGYNGLGLYLMTNSQAVATGLPGGLIMYVDAVMIAQRGKAPPTYFEFSSCNSLHHAGNAVLAQRRDGVTAYDAEVIDVERLDGTTFPHDKLVSGGRVRVTDENGSTQSEILRIMQIPDANLLEEGVTRVGLKTRAQLLSDVLGISSGGSAFPSSPGIVGARGLADTDLTPIGYRLRRVVEGYRHFHSDAVVTECAFPAESASGTLTDGSDASGGAATRATAASSGAVAYWTTAALFRRDWRSIAYGRIRTPANLSDIGIFFGLSATALSGIGTGSDPGAHSAMFRYHTGADGTAFWRCITKDTSTLEVEVTSMPIAINTVYELRIEPGASDVLFYINEQLVARIEDHLPAASTRMCLGVCVAAQAASAKSLSLYHYGYRTIS